MPSSNARRAAALSDPAGPREPASSDFWLGRILGRLNEPAVITGAQVIVYLLTATAGVLAAFGGFPNLLDSYIGAIATAVIGGTLVLGGGLGAVACFMGAWWVERVALLVCALGWVLMLPAAVSFAVDQAGSRWLIVMLLAIACGDIFKRYRRIDWAYLDPTR